MLTEEPAVNLNKFGAKKMLAEYNASMRIKINLRIKLHTQCITLRYVVITHIIVIIVVE